MHAQKQQQKQQQSPTAAFARPAAAHRKQCACRQSYTHKTNNYYESFDLLTWPSSVPGAPAQSHPCPAWAPCAQTCTPISGRRCACMCFATWLCCCCCLCCEASDTAKKVI
jgi:hypothetical protein